MPLHLEVLKERLERELDKKFLTFSWGGLAATYRISAGSGAVTDGVFSTDDTGQVADDVITKVCGDLGVAPERVLNG